MSDVPEAEIANVCNALAGSLLSWHHGVSALSPVTPHGGVSAPSGHVYDGSCAICRFSNRPEAFEVVIRAAFTAAYAIRDSSLTTRLEAAERERDELRRERVAMYRVWESESAQLAALEAAEQRADIAERGIRHLGRSVVTEIPDFPFAPAPPPPGSEVTKEET